jgi:hypothetical protein
MTTQVTIESEMKRRFDLIENSEFRQLIADAMAAKGMTQEEFDEDAGLYYMWAANVWCGLENKNGAE